KRPRSLRSKLRACGTWLCSRRPNRNRSHAKDVGVRIYKCQVSQRFRMQERSTHWRRADIVALTCHGGKMAPRGKREKLSSLSDVYGYFRRNQIPIYFLSPTAYNLLGLGRWINRFEYINFFDSFDGTHPKVTVPREHGPHEFRSIEDVNNYLLRHKEVRARIAERGPGLLLLVMFDEETEGLAGELGLKIALPPAKLR